MPPGKFALHGIPTCAGQMLAKLRGATNEGGNDEAVCRKMPGTSRPQRIREVTTSDCLVPVESASACLQETQLADACGLRLKYAYRYIHVLNHYGCGRADIWPSVPTNRQASMRAACKSWRKGVRPEDSHAQSGHSPPESPSGHTATTLRRGLTTTKPHPRPACDALAHRPKCP